MQVHLLSKTHQLTKTLTATKRAYLTAKVAKELTDKQVDKETRPLWDAMDKEMDGENRDQILTPISDQITAIENKYHKQELYDCLVKAENLLLETGADIIKHLSPERWNEIEPIFKAPYWDRHIRDKVVDLTLKLDPTR